MARHLLCLLAIFFVAACGFHPLYADRNTFAGDATSLEEIWIDNIADADGLSLRNNLIDRFYHHGTPENPTYILQIRLTQSTRDLAIRKNATTSRAQLVYRADYTLLDRQSRAILDQSSARAIGSYNILSSQYTTLVTQNKARDLALQELADKISLRMAVVLEKRTLP